MKIIFVFLTVLFLTEAADDPSIFPKCNRNQDNFSECLARSANKGWFAFVKAYKLKAIPLNNVNKSAPNFATGSITGHLAGYEGVKFHNIFVDFDQKTFDVIYSQPIISMIGDYEMKGGFQSFTIDDHGKCNVSNINSISKYHFNYEIEERDGEEYIQLTTYNLAFNTKKLIVDFTTVNNPERGEAMTTLFNTNWRIVSLLIQKYLEDVFSEAFTPIVREYLNKIPIKSLFDQNIRDDL